MSKRQNAVSFSLLNRKTINRIARAAKAAGVYALVGLVTFGTLPARVLAVDASWNVDANGNWSLAGNWDPGVPNGIGETASLTFDITAARTITQNGSITLGHLVMGDPDGSHPLILSNTAAAGAASITFNNSGTGATLTNIAGSNSNSITGTGQLILNDRLSIVNLADTNFTIANRIALSGTDLTLSANGTGVLSLTGTINGILAGGNQIYVDSSGSALGVAVSGRVNSAGGGMNITNSNGTATFSGFITGTGGLNVVNYSASNMGVTGTIDNVGAVNVTNNGTGSMTFSGTNNTTGGLNILNTDGGNITYSGNIRGAGNVVTATNEGTGIIGLSAARAITGDTILVNTGSGSIVNSGAITAAVNLTALNLGSGNMTISAGLGAQASSITATNSGGGRMGLTGSNGSTGGISLHNSGGGLMTYTGAIAGLNNALTATNNGGLSLIIGNTNSGTNSGSGPISLANLDTGNLTFRGAITGASSVTATNSANGVVGISGANSGGGAINVVNLADTNGGNFGVNYTGAITGTASSVTGTNEGLGFVAFSGANSSTGGVTLANVGNGRMTLSGAISGAGNSVTLTNFGSGVIAASGTNTSGGAVVLANDGGGAITYSGAIFGAGATVEKLGSGLAVLSGSNRFTQDLTIKEGELRVTTIGLAGANSAAGAGSAINIGDTNNALGAALSVVTAGSNNRAINFINTNSRINALGAVTFTGAVGGVGDNAIDLVLGGASTGSIVNLLTGVNSVTKVDAGTWFLDVNNTFTVDWQAGNLGFTGAFDDAVALSITNGNTGILTYAASVGTNVTSVTASNFNTGAILISGTNSSTGPILLENDSAGGRITYSGALVGAGATVSVLNSNNGTIALSGTNATGGSINLLNDPTGGVTGTVLYTGAIVGSGSTVTATNFGAAGRIDITGTNASGGAISVINMADTNGAINNGVNYTGAIVGAGTSITGTNFGLGFIQFTGTNASTGGITIANIGDGRISLTGAIIGLANSLTVTNAGNGPVLVSGTNSSGGAITLANLGAGFMTYSGAIIGADSTIEKLGSGILTLSGSNRFTQDLTIKEGELRVLTIGMAGTNSAAGAGSAINVGDTNNALGATLGYVGAAASNNRAINLINTNSRLNASGAGAVTFTGGVGGVSDNVIDLVLGGTGVGAISTLITGVNSLTKVDTGTWHLDIDQTFAGGLFWLEGNLAYYGVNNVAAGLTLTNTNTGILTYAAAIGNAVTSVTATNFNTGAILLSGTNDSDGPIALAADQGTITYSGIITSAAATVDTYGVGTVALSGSNAFTTALNVHEGTTILGTAAVVGIGMAGANSAAGAGSVINIGDTNNANGAAITYVGTNASNNRTINLINSNVRINASGAGAATFTGPVAVVSDNVTTLVLGGTGLGAITSALTDGTQPLTITKTDAGRWQLGNGTSFSGGLNIQRGYVVADSYDSFGTGMVTLGDSSNLTVAGFMSFTNGTPSLVGKQITLVGNGGFANWGTIIVDVDALPVMSGSPTYNLALGGTNTGANLVSAAITDTGAAVVSVTKTDAGRWILDNAGNSYSGGTTIMGGTLQVDDFAKLGMGELNLGNTTAGGTISYAGAGATGQVVNSAINVAGSTGGAAIVAGGSGNLVINNLVFTGTGAKTLTLSGTGAAVVSTLNSDIINNGGVTTFTKTGNNIWELTGSNTYTGITNIQGGVVRVASIAENLGSTNVIIGVNNTAAALEYVGAGETVTRTVQIGVNGNGGATLQNNGTGALVFNTLTFSGTAGSSKALTLSGSNTDTNTINAAIVNSTAGGAVGVTKAGEGTWILAGANSYTGALTVNQGLLQISGAGLLGSQGAINVRNSTLNLGATTQATVGVLTLGLAAATLSSNVTMDPGGVLNLGNNVAYVAGAANPDNGGFITGGTVNLNGYRTFTVADVALNPEDLTVDSLILDGTGGPNGIIKAGAGTLFLTNSNGYTGTTHIQAGILRVVSIADNLGSGIIAFGGPTTGTGTLEYLGAGETVAQVIDFAPNTTSGGGIILNNGTGALAINAVTFSGTGVKTVTLSGSNTDANVIGGAIVNSTDGGTTGLTKTGFGSWQLSGANSYTGNTIVNNGLLELVGAGSLSAGGNVTITNATLDLSNGSVNSIGGLLTLGVNNATLSSNLIIGAGGILNLGGNITYTGTASAVGKGFITDGTVNLNGLRTVSVAGSNIAQDDLTISSVLADGTGGPNGIVKTGAGVLVLTGNNIYTGTTHIQAGIIRVTSIANNIGSGTIAFGGPTTGTGVLEYLGAGETIGQAIEFAVTTTSGGGDIRNNGTGALAINAITMSGTGVKTVTLSGSNTDANIVDAVIGNSPDGGLTHLTKSGDGTWLLGAANNYSGNTIVNAGLLQLTGSGQLGTGNVTVRNSTLDLNGATQTIGGTLTFGIANATLTSNLVVGVGGILNLSNTVTYTTTTSGPANSESYITGGLVNLNGNRVFNIGDVVLNPYDMTISSEIADGSGTSTLIKAGNGTLRLTGSNTFTGGAWIQAGALSVDNLDIFTLSGSNIILGNAATTGTFDWTGGAETLPTVEYAGINGGGIVNNNGTGALLVNSLLFSVSGTKTVSFGGTNTGANEVSGLIVNTAQGPTNFAKNGSGTWIISGSNTFTGSTTVNEGLLEVIGDGKIGAGGLVVRNSTLDLNGLNQNVTAVTMGVANGTLTSNLILDGATLNTGGNITFAGGLQATIGDGTLSLNATRTLGVAVGTDPTGTDMVVRANIIDVNVNQTSALTKSGNGVVAFLGTNTYTGVTNVSGGILILAGTNGSVASAASTLSGNGTLRFDNSDGENSNRFGNTSSITLGGGRLEFIGGSTPGLTESVGNVTLTTNINAISATMSGGIAAELNLGSLNRAVRGGVVEFGGDADITINTFGVNTTSSNAVTGGILNGFATWQGTDWVSVNSPATQLLVYQTGSNGDAWADTDNVKIVGDIAQPSSNRIINSLKLDAANQATGLYDGLNLNITNRGILVTVDGASLTGGTINAPVVAGDDIIITVNDAAHTFTLNSTVTNNAAIATAFTKAGAGTLIVNTQQGYTSTTTVVEGTLRIGSAMTFAGGLNARRDTTVALGANASFNGITGENASTTLSLEDNTLFINNALAGNWIGQITGSGNIVKAGAGTQTISGTNLMTGTLIVKDGQLALSTTNGIMRNVTDITVTRAGLLNLNNNTSAGNVDRLNNAAVITLNQGNLQMVGGTTVAFAETVGRLVLAGGNNLLTALPSATQTNSTINSATISFTAATDALSHADANATILFRGGTTITSTGVKVGTFGAATHGSRILFSSGTTLTNGIIGGWAFAQDHQTNAVDFATYDGANGVRQLAAIGGARATQVEGALATDNVLTGGAAQTTLTGDATVNSLNVNSGPTGAAASDLGGFVLTIGSGGLIHSTQTTAAGITSTNYTISNGTVRVGTLDTAGSLYAYADTNSAIVFATNADIANNGTGELSLVASGPGTVFLQGTKSFTGSLVVNAGNVTSSNASALNSAVDVVINGGTLTLNGNNALNSLTLRGGTFAVGATGTQSALSSNALVEHGTLNRMITGTNGLIKSTDGVVTLGGNQAYTGTTQVLGGTLIASAANRLADSSTLLVDGGIYSHTTFADTINGIILKSGQLIGTTGVLTLTSTSSLTIESGTLSSIVAGATRPLVKNTDGFAAITSANTFTGGTTINGGILQVSQNANLGGVGGITMNGGALRVIGTAYSANARAITLSNTGTFDIVVRSSTANSNYAFLAPSVTGAGALVKQGDGTMALTAANAGFTGDMFIEGGTLAATANGALGTGTINIFDGATLGLLNVTALANDIVASGNSTFNLGGSSVTYTGDITINSGADLSIQTNGQTLFINSPATISGSGNLGIEGGSTVVVNNGTNALTGTVNVFGTLGGAFDFSNADVVVGAGGNIAPGNSIETTYVATLTLEGTVTDHAVWSVEVDEALSSEYTDLNNHLADIIHVEGLLDLSGLFDELNITGLDSVTFGTYPFIIASYGSLLGTFDFITGIIPPTYYVDYNYQGLNLIAIVPEPTTLSVLGLAAGLALLRRGNRRR